MTAPTPAFAQRVYDAVHSIPRGRVASYGAIAAALGAPRSARAVGRALAALGDAAGEVPWWRVVNGRGELSIRGPMHGKALQRSLLEAEGVRFTASGRIDWTRYGWQRTGDEDS